MKYLPWIAALAICASVPFIRGSQYSFADAPIGQYAVSSDGLTVLDNRTGLRWERNVTGSSTKYTWLGALLRCDNLSLGGFSTGWRVPSFKELQTIIDETRAVPPAIDLVTFPATPGAMSEGPFWSSTPNAKPVQANESYAVDFYDGTPFLLTTSTQNFVRCVR